MFTRFNRQQRMVLDEVLLDWQDRGAALRLREEFAGGMGWKTVKGREYLVRYRYDPTTGSKRFTSHGVRSPDTEKALERFHRRRAAADARLAALEGQGDVLHRLAKASGLARLPSAAGGVLRALWATGLLDEKLVVVGPPSVFAFEADAGVLFTLSANQAWVLNLVAPSQELVDEARQVVCRTSKKFHAADDEITGPDDFVLRLHRRADFERRVLGNRALDDEQFDAVRWSLECEFWTTVCVDRDGLATPMNVMDPRAFAILAAAKAEGERGTSATEMRLAMAVACLVEEGWREPFEARHSYAFPALGIDSDAGSLRI